MPNRQKKKVKNVFLVIASIFMLLSRTFNLLPDEQNEASVISANVAGPIFFVLQFHQMIVVSVSP